MTSAKIEQLKSVLNELSQVQCTFIDKNIIEIGGVKTSYRWNAEENSLLINENEHYRASFKSDDIIEMYDTHLPLKLTFKRTNP